MRYHFQAVIEKRILDTVSVSVETEGDVSEAMKLARKTLSVHPLPVQGDEVKSVYTENRDHLDTEIVHIERRVPTNERT